MTYFGNTILSDFDICCTYGLDFFRAEARDLWTQSNLNNPPCHWPGIKTSHPAIRLVSYSSTHQFLDFGDPRFYLSLYPLRILLHFKVFKSTLVLIEATAHWSHRIVTNRIAYREANIALLTCVNLQSSLLHWNFRRP